MKYLLIGAATAALMASSASAVTWQITGERQPSGGNDYSGAISSYFGGNVGFATLSGVTASSSDIFKFTLLGAESANENTFTANFSGSPESLTEGNNAFSTPRSFDLTGSISGSFSVTGGSLASNDLSFSSDGTNGVEATFGDAAMGIYFNTLNASDNLVTGPVILAFDDNGSDDNHDDMLVEAAVVPLPASALLLLGGLGGLVGLRRRKKA